MVFRLRVILFFLILHGLLPNSGIGQSEQRDSLMARIELGTILSTENDLLPFYLINNRWGEVNEGDKFFLAAELNYSKRLSKNFNLNTGFSFRNDRISSHFARIEWKKLFLSLGREKITIGGLRESLSSGSLGLSKNARPIPSIVMGTTDYIDVPFTDGFFKTKGHISHGWLEENRYISNALLHSKSFYLKLDLDEQIGWSAASGVVHFAQYGGVSPQGEKQPSSFADFLRVFAGSGLPISGFGTAGEINGLGNHLGIVETVVTQKIGKNRLTINYQKPFEDFGGLQYISFTDYLFGIEWAFPKKKSLVNRLYAEYIQTKWQGGPGLPDATDFIQNEDDNFGNSFGGRDDTYNNFLYRSGWTYKGQTIGNPLFLTYQRTLDFLEVYPDYGVAIANNRIRAVHFALEGWLGEHINYTGRLTYSENFGTYSGLYEGRFAWNGIIDDPDFEYPFRPGQEQVYSSIDLTYIEFSNELPIKLNLRLAYDFGDLYNSFGSEISITYLFNKN